MRMGNFSYEVLGAKLRAIRKAKHISLNDVAQALNKSVSTVAKYETGEINIDLESLLLICEYFQINSADLLPNTSFDSAAKGHPRYKDQMVDRVYIYYYRAYDRWIHRCVIENDNTTFKSILYFDVKSELEPYQCNYVYEGTVHYTDSHTYYVFYNITKPFDMITINSPSLSQGYEYRIGLLSSITVYYQNMAGKILISDTPIQDQSLLMDNLVVDKQTLKELRRTNFFIV